MRKGNASPQRLPMHAAREAQKNKGWPSGKAKAVDHAWDKAHKIKEGSWQDEAIDAAAKKRAK